MTYSIALAGKGGTGKTTTAGLLVKYLIETGKIPILAVDADSNANFNEVLGLEVEETLGDAREDMKTGAATGMTKDIFMQMKLEQAVVEAKDYDLIVMGGIENVVRRNSYKIEIINREGVLDNTIGIDDTSGGDLVILLMVHDLEGREQVIAVRERREESRRGYQLCAD